MKTGSQEERTCSKVVFGRPSEVADCGAGWAKLQLAGDLAIDCTTQGSSVGK